MLKKIFMSIAIMGMILLFTQCTDRPVVPDKENPALKAGKGNGNGPGGGSGNGKGNGGLNSGNGGGGGIYGDLTICLRNADGVPNYLSFVDEHGETTYYAQPIKVNSSTLEPLRLNPFESPYYDVFDFNTETGEFDAPDGIYVIKEVDFGRINVVRSPPSTLRKALGEAISTLTDPNLTDIKLDASGRLVVIFGAEDWLVNYDQDLTNDETDDKTIDSPVENLAIYQELMSNGFNGELGFLQQYFGDLPDPVLTLAYGALAGGGDKTGIIIVDEIGYINEWVIDWKSGNVTQALNSPDPLGRHFFDFSDYQYSRSNNYQDKYIRLTEVRPNGQWEEVFVSLNDSRLGIFTNPHLLIDYAEGQNTNITGFANAANDAIQVLEFIHSSDLIVYSPYFTATGFQPPESD